MKDEGFCGVYYPGEKYPAHALIVAGGAIPNKNLCVMMARSFITAGFNVLVLGMYGWKGLPSELRQIPVEYAERAIKWLKTEKHIERIAINGVSTGAGYALLIASLLPDISCVLVGSPFDHVMEACVPPRGSKYQPSDCSVYTWHGQDLPFTKWKARTKTEIPALRKACEASMHYGKGFFARYFYDLQKLDSSSRIRVENMNADIFLCAADHDNWWPSEDTVLRVRKILKENHYTFRVETKIYKRASHALGCRRQDQKGIAKILWPLMMRIVAPVEKQFPEECERAREESTAVMIEFLEMWIKQYQDPVKRINYGKEMDKVAE